MLFPHESVARPQSLPVAHAGPHFVHEGQQAQEEEGRRQEQRLQSAVCKEHAPDEADPYADVPCTD